MENIIKLQICNITKQFEGDDTPTLNNINLEIQKGEFICVVGMSGCGKSTLLNIIAGLDSATSGTILLDQKPISEPGIERTVMFQEHGLFPWLNVIDNVCFGLKMQGLNKSEQFERARYYLDMVQLSDYETYPIHQLSGGMRQRVALARALAIESDVLLMDEPFSALDKQTSNYLRTELQRIWLETHKTIFFITHSVEEAVFLSDRIVVLSPQTHGIIDIINNKLPRPRHVYSPEFVDMRHKLLEEVRGELI